MAGVTGWRERSERMVQTDCIQIKKEQGQPYCELVEIGRRGRQNPNGWRCVSGEAAGEQAGWKWTRR